MAHLTRRGLMWSAAATGLLGARFARAQASTPRKLIYVLADGGWDVTYCFDSKLGVPTVEGPELDPEGAQEAVQTFHGIPIVVNESTRPSVSRFFQNWASEAAVVTGIHVGTIGHTPSRFRILTGSSGQRPGLKLRLNVF